jgi:hypothetical protein
MLLSGVPNLSEPGGRYGVAQSAAAGKLWEWNVPPGRGVPPGGTACLPSLKGPLTPLALRARLRLVPETSQSGQTPVPSHQPQIPASGY